MAISRVAPRFGLGVAIIVLTFLIPATAISGGFDAKGGRYKGAEGTGLESQSVHFKVTKHDRVRHPEFWLVLTSSSSCYTYFAIKGRDQISDQGKFKLTERHAWFKGKFVSRGKVKGKMYGEREGCGSETVSYEARWVSRGKPAG